ncbi:MAG: HEAT repeat domain-containing protein [Blastocatellia bacterium]|nr:HEAT repeat domain-containing protein [Blastocatellia bacterium]
MEKKFLLGMLFLIVNGWIEGILAGYGTAQPIPDSKSLVQSVSEDTSVIKEKSILALCKVIETQPDDRPVGMEFISTMEVLHVFHGPDSFTGRTFQVAYYEKNMNFGRAYQIINPKLESGEITVWALLRVGNQLTVFPHSNYGVPFPSRSNQDFLYPQVLDLAKAVESVSRSPKEKAVQLLKELAVSQSPEISTWAVKTLGAMDDSEGVDFLKSLAVSGRSTIRGQTALDRILTEKLGVTWQNSRARLELEESWVKAPLTDSEATYVIDCLDVLSQWNTVESKLLLNLMKKLLANPQVSIDMKVSSYKLPYFPLLRGYMSSNDACEFFMGQLQNEEPKLAVGAAKCLTRLPLTEPQRERLKPLSLKPRHEEVTRIIQEILQRQQQP